MFTCSRKRKCKANQVRYGKRPGIGGGRERGGGTWRLMALAWNLARKSCNMHHEPCEGLAWFRPQRGLFDQHWSGFHRFGACSTRFDIHRGGIANFVGGFDPFRVSSDHFGTVSAEVVVVKAKVVSVSTCRSRACEAIRMRGGATKKPVRRFNLMRSGTMTKSSM